MPARLFRFPGFMSYIQLIFVSQVKMRLKSEVKATSGRTERTSVTAYTANDIYGRSKEINTSKRNILVKHKAAKMQQQRKKLFP